MTNRRKKATSTTTPPKTTRPSNEFKIELLNAAQKMAWAGFQNHDVLFLLGPAGCGKAQPLDSIVYTPTGAKTMGEVKVGDTVLSPYGTSVVKNEYPQGKIEIYRVNFVDGDSVECCKNHLWEVHNPNNQWRESKVVSTEFLIENCRKQNRRNFEIALPQKVDFEKRNILIDPYLLGFLIGDGTFRGSVPRFSTGDLEILENIQQTLDINYRIKKLKTKYDYSISQGYSGGKLNIYTQALRTYGLWDKKSEHKFIPDDYLFNTKEIRISILQGLMDSDGSVSLNGHVEFSTSSKKLSQDIKLLVQSLGGLCTIVERKTNCLPSYRCHIKYMNPSELFSLERKKARCKPRKKLVRRIKNIDYVGIKEAKCISLDTQHGLYLTNNFVITHNTFLATAFAIQAILGKQKEKIVLTRPVVESGEHLGFLPGDLAEKLNPYMMPIYNCMDKLVGIEGPLKEKILSRTKIVPIAFMRGWSFDDSICLFDEAQNATKSQLKLFLTRFGKNSKIIITGDPQQSDIGDSSGLLDVVNQLREIPGIGIIEFKNNSIVRHPLVGAILDKLENR